LKEKLISHLEGLNSEVGDTKLSILKDMEEIEILKLMRKDYLFLYTEYEKERLTEKFLGAQPKEGEKFEGKLKMSVDAGSTTFRFYLPIDPNHIYIDNEIIKKTQANLEILEIRLRKIDEGCKKEKYEKKRQFAKEIKDPNEKNSTIFEIDMHSSMDLEKGYNQCLKIIMNHFKIKKKHGKYPVVMFWGHWSQKGSISTKLKDHWLLKHGVEHFVVDESWSSKVHYLHPLNLDGTINGICTPVTLQKAVGRINSSKNHNQENEKKQKSVSVWHLIECDNCEHRMQRDQNGCINIFRIAMDILNYQFRFFPRYVKKNNKDDNAQQSVVSGIN